MDREHSRSGQGSLAFACIAALAVIAGWAPSNVVAATRVVLAEKFTATW